jgi:SAM-dependent methyltransferase
MNAGYHQSRFTADKRRDVLWETLCQGYFRHRIPSDGCVLDLGAGYGQFINNVAARRRIAIDVWSGFTSHLAPGIEGIVGDISDLSMLEDSSVDYAFASNVFEHLSQPRLALTLASLAKKLSAVGTLTILQPNYRYAYREYFDDYTHISVWSHVALADFLVANGYEVIELRPRFLPLTIKSRLPVWPLLIRAYLASPIKPLAKQMLVVARLNRSLRSTASKNEAER